MLIQTVVQKASTPAAPAEAQETPRHVKRPKTEKQ
jgi:hypothetical protein